MFSVISVINGSAQDCITKYLFILLSMDVRLFVADQTLVFWMRNYRMLRMAASPDKYSDWSFHTTTLSFIVCMQHSSVCFETLDNLRTINRSKRQHLLTCSLTSVLFSSFIFCSFLHSRPHVHREEWYVFLYIARLCLYLHTGSDLIHMQHNRCWTQYNHIRSTKYWSHN